MLQVQSEGKRKEVVPQEGRKDAPPSASGREHLSSYGPSEEGGSKVTLKREVESEHHTSVKPAWKLRFGSSCCGGVLGVLGLRFDPWRSTVG